MSKAKPGPKGPGSKPFAETGKPPPGKRYKTAAYAFDDEAWRAFESSASKVDAVDWQSFLDDPSTASEADHAVFDLRCIQRYCYCVRHELPVEPWIAKFLARQFMAVLEGEKWCDALGLPWIGTTPTQTRAEEIAVEVALDVFKKLQENPKQPIVELLDLIASKRGISYQTARAAYYRWKPLIERQIAQILKETKKT